MDRYRINKIIDDIAADNTEINSFEDAHNNCIKILKKNGVNTSIAEEAYKRIKDLEVPTIEEFRKEKNDEKTRI